MERYEILAHRGDAKIKAYGATKEELFQNALEGMNAVLRPRGVGGSPSEREIAIESPDENALLVDFLNEANYLRQIHREAYESAHFSAFSGTALKGTLAGRAAEGFGEDIKAVTFHNVSIHQNEQGLWQTDIVFDV